MLLEEKRYKSPIKRFQRQLFDILDCCAREDNNYRGFHIVKFENTSPFDGAVYLDGIEITTPDLIEFLRME